MNFDLALFSSESNTICLVECKANVTTRLRRTVNAFQSKIEFVEKNNEVVVEDYKMRIKDYFEKALGIDKPNFYYILASELVDLGSSLDELIQQSEYPFDIWRCQLLTSGGIRIQRIPIPSRGDEEKNISKLTSYLDKTHPQAGNALQICLSSNKYYLAVQSCINLRSLDSFTFKDFLESFSIDLKDYGDFEKQFLFKQFVDFGKECNLLKILNDTGNDFTSSYVVINRKKKSKQLQENVISKMAENRVETDPEIAKRVEDERRIIIQEIYEKKYKQKNLSEYMDKED